MDNYQLKSLSKEQLINQLLPHLGQLPIAIIRELIEREIGFYMEHLLKVKEGYDLGIIQGKIKSLRQFNLSFLSPTSQRGAVPPEGA